MYKDDDLKDIRKTVKRIKRKDKPMKAYEYKILGAGKVEMTMAKCKPGKGKKK